jgi:regulatory subunit for Cdc7p protein kinase
MATVMRRQPLTSRTLSLTTPAIVSPLKTFVRTVSGSTKRPRSPEPDINASTNTVKRAKAAAPRSPAIGGDERKAKEQKRAERELQRAEFKAKYTKAFPSWSFYFDLDHLDGDDSARELLESKISHLGGVCELLHIREPTIYAFHSTLKTSSRAR